METQLRPADTAPPIVTIGMPVYNSSQSVRASVEAVAGQSWSGPLELLIVDDGSDDDTPEVLAALAAEFAQLRIVTHPQNLGRPAARNTVLEYARGEYLTWLDADDTIHPEKIERQLTALLRYGQPSDRAIAICGFRVKWHGRGRGRVHHPKLDGNDLRRVLDASIPAYLWTMMCCTDLMRQVGGFDENLPRLQDLDITLRLLRHGAYFVPTDAEGPLCYYHKSDDGKSGRVVFGSMQRIWTKHRALYHLFGPYFVRKCRHMHYLLGARHAASNGEWGLWLHYMVGASWNRPREMSRRLRKAALGLPRRAVRKVMA